MIKAKNINHDCTYDDNCPICEIIHKFKDKLINSLNLLRKYKNKCKNGGNNEKMKYNIRKVTI